MPVVPAGVHLAGVGGGKGQAGLLLDGERIGVTAEGDGVSLPKVKKSAQGTGDGREQGAAQRLQHAA